jgi:anthranilate synthase component I
MATGDVLIRKRIADTETPVSAMLKLGFTGTPSFLLESVEGGANLGRYSILGCHPDLIWRAFGARCEVNRTAQIDSERFTPCADDTLTSLRALVTESRLELPKDVPGAVATLVGYMGYDTIGLVEHLPAPKADAIGAPDMLFIRPTLLLVFDRLKDELTLLAPVFEATAAKMERARDLLDDAEKRLDASLPAQTHVSLPTETDVTPVLPAGRYTEMVRRAKDYIAAGDIFQVVLAQRFTRPFDLPPFELYRALRRINPSPFLYFLNLPGFAVVGSSPEILVRVRDGKITIRPIAGTRPRGKNAEEDQQNQMSLLADPKELAEHLMLLDLGRNDVGRVAEPGSVRITEQYNVELYSHVMHIVSNVEGDVAPDKDVLDALFAGFPAGTVSGAPKIRAMQIIHELENEKRGIYGGGVGYFGADGSMDSCIVLRTAIVKDGIMHVQAGAGIVTDSDPVTEQQECEAKSGALLAAAREAYHVAGRASRGQ